MTDQPLLSLVLGHTWEARTTGAARPDGNHPLGFQKREHVAGGMLGGRGREVSRAGRVRAHLSSLPPVQGPRGERGPRGITGKPGPKVGFQ